MDGNGRWAGARGLPRVAGHRAGADALRRVVESAPGLGIGVLTLYSFSSDNWQRPPAKARDGPGHASGAEREDQPDERRLADSPDQRWRLVRGGAGAVL